ASDRPTCRQVLIRRSLGSLAFAGLFYSRPGECVSIAFLEKPLRGFAPAVSFLGRWDASCVWQCRSTVTHAPGSSRPPSELADS
ncbi:uncharacterized protein P884DRAFT_221145, partial [Thermothelomyces heterothallicus CBS 202.75]|uniref:uncharacterized protein n=1 Tax=Thermothelomyces heterothallicus CBS 202.75 TaxID=1149848 RepID=UPI003742A80D